MAHGLSIHNDDESEEIPYNVFIRSLICAMNGHTEPFECAIYANCEYCTDSSDSDVRVVNSYASELVLRWNGTDLSIYKDETRVYYLKEILCDTKTPREYITVGTMPYMPIIHTNECNAALYAWIYHELPALFSVVGIVRHLSTADIAHY